MRGYVQRLMDRSAGLAGVMPNTMGAPAPADAAPALASRSPVVSFDQRLATPGLADDLSIFGFSPETPDIDEGSSTPLAPPLSTPRPAPTPDLVPPRPFETKPVAVPAPEAGPWEPPAPTPAAAPRPQPTHGEEAHTPPPRATEAAPRPLPRPGPPLAPTDASRGESISPQRAAPPRPAPQALVQQRVVREAEHAAATPADLPAPPRPSIVAEPAALRETVIARREPPQTETRARAASAQAREVTPQPPAPPEPLAPPAPAAMDRRLIERIARETVRTELARLPPSQQKQPAHAAPANDVSQPPPPPRPMTAREASIIGDLESSSRPLTIYGLRRR